MKNTLVPMLCSVALALMAGAGASHFYSVKQMATFAQLSQSGRLRALPTADRALLASTTDPKGTRALIATLQQQNRALEQSLASSKNAIAQRNDPSKSTPDLSDSLATTDNDELKRFLSGLLAQNRDLQNQIAETNRDLMEVNFRFDSMDGQFRPLNLAEESAKDDPYDPSIGVLPPLDIP